jgi:hypothetical protein
MIIIALGLESLLTMQKSDYFFFPACGICFVFSGIPSCRILFYSTKKLLLIFL